LRVCVWEERVSDAVRSGGGWRRLSLFASTPARSLWIAFSRPRKEIVSFGGGVGVVSGGTRAIEDGPRVLALACPSPFSRSLARALSDADTGANTAAAAAATVVM
jgi:hypothetical protein